MKDEKAKIKELRQFGITLGIIMGVIGSVQFFKGHVDVSLWLLGTALFIFLSGIVFPLILKPLFFVFTKVTHAIGWFNTKLILVLVYYLVLTPIGLLMKLFNYDPLDRKIYKEAETYWIDKEVTIATRESLEKQF